MKTNPNDPINVAETNNWPMVHHNKTGLTKREYFAALAMQGMIANSNDRYINFDPREIAEISVLAAEALIKDLNRDDTY